MRTRPSPIHLFAVLAALSVAAGASSCAPASVERRAITPPLPAAPPLRVSPAPASPPAAAAALASAHTAANVAGAPPPDHRWAEVATGADHTCARTRAGEVYCWGGNDRGQLGDGSKTDRLSPTRVQLGEQALELGLANYSSCARLAGGTVACWGSSDGWDDKEAGQLGQYLSPVAAVGVTGATRLFIGRIMRSCVARSDGAVICWGFDTEPSFPRTAGPRDAPALGGALQIGHGMSFGCALWEIPGELRCWGRESLYRVFGDARTIERKAPSPIPKLPRVRAFFADFGRTCAIAEDETVYCWGDRLDLFESGGPTLEWLDPTRVKGLDQIVAVAQSLFVLCALRRDGAVLCLGRNDVGQLGDGTKKRSLSPSRVAGVEDAVGIASSGDHACAVSRGGKLWCWGANAKGQIGDGTRANKLLPVEITL